MQQIPNNLNRWKNHPFGLCMTQDNSEYMYVNIPKNASTWTKKVFQILLNFSERNFYKENLNKSAIVVLRDPIDRWCSGMTEYFFRQKILNKDKDFLFKHVQEKLTWDEHTDIQSYFLHDYPKVYYFYVNSNYEKNIRHFISNFMDKKYFLSANMHARVMRKNRAEDNPIRNEYKNIFREFAESPKLLSNLRDYYKIDYDLIDKTTFYEANRPII